MIGLQSRSIYLIAPGALVVGVAEGEAQGEKNLTHSQLERGSYLHLRGVVDSFCRGRGG